jgi:hypothetical protein
MTCGCAHFDGALSGGLGKGGRKKVEVADCREKLPQDVVCRISLQFADGEGRV